MAAELHAEGLQFLLEVAFSEEQSPLGAGTFYVGLCTDASLAEDATMATIHGGTEVTGTGYARQTLASSAAGFTSATAGTADRKVTTAEVTFTATDSDWDGANTVFMTTAADGSGKLIASAPLSTTRTLGNGDTLTVALAITLAG